MSRIFEKLAVSSRAQVAARIAAEQSASPRRPGPASLALHEPGRPD
jgi:hypothetical protein